MKKEHKFIENPLMKETKARLLGVRIAKLVMESFEIGYEFGKNEKGN